MTNNMLDQNFTLGVLGGGQLGRMLIQSAIDFNLTVAVLDPNDQAPCRWLAHRFEVGALTDYDSVYQFGQTCDLITIEIENVNTEALRALQKEGKQVFPQPEVIELIQDKRKQKEFYRQQNIPSSDFILVENKEDLQQHADFLPAFQKLALAGYDGRGVQKISVESDFAQGFEEPSLLEKTVDIDREISIIVARNGHGEIKTFPAVEMVFHPEHHLVDYLISPPDVDPALLEEAANWATKLVQKLDLIGLLAVEMFVTRAGKILVNEIAPRTHNSGHQTIEANHTSQFEQHLRAILNLPLGHTGTLMPSIMVNLLGEPGYQGQARYQGLNHVLSIEGVHVHLYGKTMTKPFRKMGHVTITGSSRDALKETATFVKQHLKVIS